MDSGGRVEIPFSGHKIVKNKIPHYEDNFNITGNCNHFLSTQDSHPHTLSPFTLITVRLFVVNQYCLFVLMSFEPKNISLIFKLLE